MIVGWFPLRRSAIGGSVLLLVSATIGAVSLSTSLSSDLSRQVALVNDATALDGTGGIALVMGPTGIPNPSDAYVDTVERLYLEPLGFSGTAESLYTPENSGNTDAGLADDVKYIMEAVHAQLATGDVSADNPIWLFGYSQSTAAAALAAEQLHAEGVPADELHFVLVGDSASAHGGLLNALMPSMPDWLQELVKPLLPAFGVENSIGLTTPDYYPTDVYTISNDGYAAWPSDISDWNAVSNALIGMFSSHEYYLGLEPSQIPLPGDPTFTDGLANYFTIDATGINGWDTLVQAAENLGYISQDLANVLELF